jgi:hypothetical protein
MSAVATGIAVGAIGAERQSQAAREAAAGQQGAANLSLAEMKRQYDISQNNLAPWMRAGRRALTEQEALMGLGGDTASSLRSLQSAPGYQSRLQQGNRALEGGLAARGGMGSGKSATAASGWNQEFASNEYANRLNQLAGLSGTGQSTASGLANLGQNYAQGMGNIWQGNANAQGAAGIAGQNAWQSGVLGGLGAGMNMNNYFNRQRTPYNWATDQNPNYSGPGVQWPYP